MTDQWLHFLHQHNDHFHLETLQVPADRRRDPEETQPRAQSPFKPNLKRVGPGLGLIQHHLPPAAALNVSGSSDGHPHLQSSTPEKQLKTHPHSMSPTHIHHIPATNHTASWNGKTTAVCERNRADTIESRTHTMTTISADQSKCW
ncbi:hypothetical protein CRENBAI_004385 [Crenichthys baileyi]|uniref:Uncharacterized protein n=1 Tax=Crenichthys baileyi TaxID=28760 RepID=A0AAV9S1V4_9TELE